jgi:hypothetical protein
VQIEVKSAEVERVEGMWEGKPTLRFTQWALLTQGGFALSFTVSHNDAKDALQPGLYDLDPTSFSTRNGRLSVERVKLKPAAGRPVPVAK